MVFLKLHGGTTKKRISHYIGGRVVEGNSDRSGPVFNPATGRQTGEVDFASPAEVDAAVAAATAAFPAWRATSCDLSKCDIRRSLPITRAQRTASRKTR